MTLVWVKLTKAHQSSWVNGTCLLLSLSLPPCLCVFKHAMTRGLPQLLFILLALCFIFNFEAGSLSFYLKHVSLARLATEKAQEISCVCLTKASITDHHT